MSDHITAGAPTICPSCKESFAAVDPDRSTHFGCPFCGSYFVDEWDEEKRRLRQFDPNPGFTAALLPGSKGRLNDVPYTVAGVIVKEEIGDRSSWTEYVLYGPGNRSAVLVEVAGEWILSLACASTPRQVDANVHGEYRAIYEGVNYEAHHDYKAVVKFAKGSFDWNILDDESLDIWEYVARPKMLSLERSKNGDSWYIGTLIEPAIIAEAFHEDLARFPKKSGPGMLSPNPFGAQLKWLYRIAFIAVAFVALLQFCINYIHPKSELLNTVYIANADSLTTAGEKPVGNASFHVQSKSALSVALGAKLENNWLEVAAVLVNDKTGKVYESVKSLERYSGYEDEESWTESDNDKEMVFSSVPAGDYHLNVTATGDPTNNAGYIPMTVKVTHENWILSNFFLILLVIVAFPLIVRWRSNRFDQNN